MVERKGRGNRVGGLITPCRPMTLEAAAGKNAAMHVGKSYSIVSRTGWRERSWRSALTSPRPPVSW
jgi:S-adenosylmethionine synthetase